MENFFYNSPTKFYFGKDTHLKAGSILKEDGAKKALLYYGGGSIIKSGLYDAVKKSMEEAGLDYVELGGVRPNPTLSFCRKTVDFIKENGVDYILAVGGGSVIDSAKVAAIAVATGVDPWQLSSGEVKPEGTLPLGVILTIAATGSEASNSAVITNEELKRKKGLSTEFNRPRFAIMNPELTYTLPPYQTAAGVTDIMMHTLERYVSLSGDNLLLDGMAEGLIRAVIDAGRKAMDNPCDYQARATLMWAGTLSHNGLMGLGRKYHMTAHKLQHEMSALNPDVAHGAGLAVVWPAYCKYIYKYDIPRFCQYAVRIWGCTMNYYDPEATALEGIRRTEEYFRSIGMPTRLGELGFDESHIPALTAGCCQNGTLTFPSLVPIDAKAVEEIYRLAL